MAWLKSEIVHLLHFVQFYACRNELGPLVKNPLDSWKKKKKLLEFTFPDRKKLTCVWIYQEIKGYKIPGNILEVFTHPVKKKKQINLSFIVEVIFNYQGKANGKSQSKVLQHRFNIWI